MSGGQFELGPVASSELLEAPEVPENGWKSFAKSVQRQEEGLRLEPDQSRTSGLVIRWYRMEGYRSTDKSYPWDQQFKVHRRGRFGTSMSLMHPGRSRSQRVGLFAR